MENHPSYLLIIKVYHTILRTWHLDFQNTGRLSLYGFSSNDFLIAGASKEKKIHFYALEKKLPSGNSILKIIARSILLFLIFARELTAREYDIVHIQERLPLFFLFIPLLKLNQKKLFWTIHDIDLLPLSEGFRGRIEVMYRNAISQPDLLAKYSDSIIVHAESLKEQLVAKKVDRNKIHVIRHMDYGYLLKYDTDDGMTSPEVTAIMRVTLYSLVT